MKITKRKRFVLFLIVLLFLIIISLSPLAVTETSKPNFCNICHVMENEYEDWFLTGLHRNITCVDCHLPNDNIINHLFWKAIDGTKDVISFYGRLYPERITVSSHGRKALKENCIRCHENMVSRVNVEGRDCWSCHRRVKHTFSQAGINY